MPDAETFAGMKTLFDGLSLRTICESAICPNQGDCFSKGTATFLLLGDVCTRQCAFCAVKKGLPAPLDEEEPQHLAEAVKRLGLKYVVLTSVTRDDLLDGGASQFVRAIAALRANHREISIEVLVPDFGGSLESLKKVVTARPDVMNHNMETVRSLYPQIRPQADFNRSLQLLEMAKEIDPDMVTKSGLMVGLGETREELIQTLEELRRVDCDLLTLGQYLQPSPLHHPVIRYVPPEEFEEYAETARTMGFCEVASGPFVRSSYDAARFYAMVGKKKEAHS